MLGYVLKTKPQRPVYTGASKSVRFSDVIVEKQVESFFSVNCKIVGF